MQPITRRDIEILLDSPHQKDYVVSAYADMRVKDGFHRLVDVEFRNQARALNGALSATEASRVLDSNLEAIRRAVDTAAGTAKGLAVFSGSERKLFHTIVLDFPVENYLVIDEEPYVLPLLERWYGEPNYLVAVVDSHHLHLFEAHAGVAEEVGGIDRDIDSNIQRDKPRFTYKKRFSNTRHERLHALDDDGFFKEGAEAICSHWNNNGAFAGLILLGQSPVTAALRRLLPKEVDQAVVSESAQAITARADDVVHDVSRAMEKWRASRRQTILAELQERWKENHLVANGPTSVLDALQQGRATQVIVGPRRDFAGARCSGCGYRFGAPIGVCVYCQGTCQSINAVQETLRMALRHRVPVYLFPRNGDDPLEKAGGMAALLRAEANWAPNAETARASMGH